MKALATARETVASAEASCPACGGPLPRPFFEIAELPVNCISLLRTRAEALACPKGRIELALCGACGAISNTAFQPSLVGYDASYDNSLHFSPTFQRYADEIASFLIARYDLRGKNIVDVGCGNAEFLAILCGRGGNRGIGFDPSFIAGRADMSAGSGITIIRDYYSERHAGHAADVVICRHVLEHIANPRDFLRNIRAALADKPGAAVFFEVPNAAFIFETLGIWDIIYEHCFYYTAESLTNLFTASGFDVISVAHTFNGQYLCLEARPSVAVGVGPAGRAPLDDVRTSVSAFARAYASSLTEWGGLVRGAREAGKRVAVWGAGAKGAMFLNAFRGVDGLNHIVDVNPNKHGLHVPGTGQRVGDPQSLINYDPHAILVMNPNYEEEIRRQVSAMGLAPDFVAI